MNLKRLQTFIQVVEKRSFSEVAEILNITQSGVSRQIKTLEKEVDVQLLNRNTAHVELTSAGKVVYQKAKSLLDQWNQLLLDCQSLKEEINGVLKIGTSTIPATYLIPKILKTCKDKYPQVEFCMITKDSTEILNALENGRIDVAIVGSKPQCPDLNSSFIAEDKLVLIGNNAVNKVGTMEEIKNLPIILREKGSGTREAMDKALKTHGVELDNLNCAIEVNSTDSVLAMVEAGIGVSFVSHWALKETSRDKIHVLLEIPTDRGFYLTAMKNRYTHPLVQIFMQETMKIYQPMINR